MEFDTKGKAFTYVISVAVIWVFFILYFDLSTGEELFDAILVALAIPFVLIVVLVGVVVTLIVPCALSVSQRDLRWWVRLSGVLGPILIYASTLGIALGLLPLEYFGTVHLVCIFAGISALLVFSLAS